MQLPCLPSLAGCIQSDYQLLAGFTKISKRRSSIMGALATHVFSIQSAKETSSEGTITLHDAGLVGTTRGVREAQKQIWQELLRSFTKSGWHLSSDELRHNSKNDCGEYTATRRRDALGQPSCYLTTLAIGPASFPCHWLVKRPQ